MGNIEKLMRDMEAKINELREDNERLKAENAKLKEDNAALRKVNKNCRRQVPEYLKQRKESELNKSARNCPFYKTAKCVHIENLKKESAELREDIEYYKWRGKCPICQKTTCREGALVVCMSCDYAETHWSAKDKGIDPLELI